MRETYHIRVVPFARPSDRSQDVLVVVEPVRDAQDAVPGVLDVPVVPPQVADLPQLGVVHLVGCNMSLHLLSLFSFFYYVSVN